VRILAAAGGLLVAIGVGAVVALLSQPGAAAPAPYRPVSDLTPAERAVLGKLDRNSRPVAEALLSNDLVSATYVTGDARRAALVVDRARALGLEATVEDEERRTVRVSGTRSTTLVLAGLPVVNLVFLEENDRVDRPLAAPLPRPLVVPQPGTPYRILGLPADGGGLSDLGNRRATILAGLADVVVTIDGQPYADVEWAHACDPGECSVALAGRPAGGVARDQWAVHGSEPGGWIGRALPDDPPVLLGVPRWLTREAERIARTDPAAEAAIAAFDWIGETTWDPAAPGVITLYYLSACGCCGLLDDPLAAQVAEADPDPGACAPGLQVSVDVGAGRVVAIRAG
jgi:hypothetical protein